MIQFLFIFFFLFAIISIVSNQYAERMKRIQEHTINRDITVRFSPDAMKRNELRRYTVTFKKDSQEQTTTIDALNLIDAKFRVIRQFDIAASCILSVV